MSEHQDVVRATSSGDIYLTSAYHQVSSRLEDPGTVEALFTTGSFNLRLLLRPISDGFWDATSCYGYGGPWLRGEGADLDLDEIGDEFDSWAREKGVVSTFLRFHPVLGNSRLAPKCFDVIELNETIAWPIGEDVDILASMKKKHRQYTRKGEREGLTHEVVDRPGGLTDFVDLYEQSMDRLDADGFYKFPPEYWEAMAEEPDLHTILVNVHADGELVASLLCLVGEELLHAHLLGTNERGRESKANYLAYYAAAKWGQNNGLRIFHLGGGYGGQESDLFDWKKGFCPDEPTTRFSIGKAVHDPGKYRELAGTDSTDGFFPPWRNRSE